MPRGYDYIIVGAGSAGCVLAERLRADPGTRVLLLEAGGSDRRFWIKLPIGYGRTFYDERVNWKYQSEPDAGTGNTELPDLTVVLNWFAELHQKAPLR